ncbi:JM19 [macacine gammaherpesvirus 11]|uniref:JM19 n=2 Tax=macacine gammaherpesvirus 11 TaxID=2560570 RepID=G9JM27_9GAMA|nr:JM19 [Macaca fuscata rhadinovirus]AAS99996.1 JM19 [Macaca fuscata rhadinovirus]AEW87544.1 JM19 [Macaca fuscata rhadinovirus]AEW87714.1 JM19 [Macaca fuscata rhadinovirus]
MESAPVSGDATRSRGASSAELTRTTGQGAAAATRVSLFIVVGVPLGLNRRRCVVQPESKSVGVTMNRGSGATPATRNARSPRAAAPCWKIN